MGTLWMSVWFEARWKNGHVVAVELAEVSA